MRARERARCERAAEALLPGVVVVWAREIPHAYAYALWPSGIVLGEASFGKAPAPKRWTLIAHEIAHLIVARARYADPGPRPRVAPSLPKDLDRQPLTC